MGQSSSVAGRGSRRRTDSNAISTAQAGTESPIAERPAVTSDDLIRSQNGAAIQTKNDAVERCNSINKQDMLDPSSSQVHPNNVNHPSSSDDALRPDTSDRPQRTHTSYPSYSTTRSSGRVTTVASTVTDPPSIPSTRPLDSTSKSEEEASSSSSSINTKSRSFLSNLRSRRLSRRTSSSPTVLQESDDTALEIPIPSTSKLTLEDTTKDQQENAESSYTALQMPMTPPEEQDAMFEDRQRARRMIEATLMSAGSDIHRPLPSARSASSYPSAITTPFGPAASFTTPPPTHSSESNTSIPLGPPACASSPLPLPISQSSAGEAADHTHNSSTSAGSSAQIQTPDRVYAVLPRRSRSNSPVPSVQSAPATPAAIETLEPPSAAPSLESIALRNTSSDSDSSAPVTPRHVLVQGLVAQAPSRRFPSRNRVPSTPSRQSREYDLAMNSDSGFWDELPGSDAMEVDSNDAAEDSEDEDWQSTVNQLLNIRRDSPAGERPAGTDPADSEEDGIEGQANLIGRLLRVAAAATAATLLPGGLTVDGHVVPGFDDSGALRALTGRGRSSSGQQTFPSNSSDTSPSTSSTDNGSALVGSDNGTATSVDPMNGNGAAQAETSNEVAASESLFDLEASAAVGEAASAYQLPLQSALSVPAAASFPSQTPSHRDSDLSTPLGPSIGPSSTAMDISPPPTPTSSLERASNGRPTSPTSTAPPALSRPDNSLQRGNSLLPGIMPLRTPSGSLAPEGTFDRFLADLQRDVSSAIRSSVNRENSTTSAPASTPPLVPDTSNESMPSSVSSGTNRDSSTPGPDAQAARPFSFFRAYRFPSRSMPTAGGIPSSSTASSARVPSVTGVPPALAEPSSDGDRMQIDQPTPQAAVPAGSSTATPSIVPMLFVGVRTAPSSMLDDLPNSFGANPSTARHEPTISSARQDAASGDSEMRDATDQIPASNNAQESQDLTSDAPRVHGFVLWIFGGLYPPTHPVVLAPSLLGDDAMSYEEMMRLADMIGQHKPPTVSKQEIAEAGLKTLKGGQVKTAEAEGNVRSITADRCLICLEDYEAEEDVRVLNCLHCFHQGCVDRWLSDGANTCPACRKAGVEKEAKASLQTGEATEPGDTPAETTATSQEVPQSM